MSEENLNFEESFIRLQEILDRMNSGKISLDESLKLYEEADRLIAGCTHRLNSVEARIEMLIKKRNGELELDEASNPLSEPFLSQEIRMET